MNPYRSVSVEPRSSTCRKRRTSQEKTAVVLLVIVAAVLAAFIWQGSTWLLCAGGGAILIFIAVAMSGRSRTPHTRLCALQWNRGDRFGAVMLFFNVTEPRYSAKRIARNKAALEAAQVGMPKEWWFNSFAKRDDK